MLRGAEEIAAAVLDQAGVGVGPVGVVEGGQGGDRAAALTPPRTPCRRRSRRLQYVGAEEIAAAVLDQAGVGIGAVGAVERGQGGDRAAAVRHLEHRAVASARRLNASVPKRLPLLSSTRPA